MMLYYLGPRGSHTERAALKFSELMGIETTPADSIYSVFEEVLEGNYGVVPTENSVEGSVNLTLDLLFENQVRILAETSLEIRHSLLGFDEKKIEKVLSHPQALAQCRKFIREHGWEAVATKSTSEAAKIVSELGDPRLAAIASKETGELYGLKVLEEDVQDYPNNKTRFILIGPEGKSLSQQLGPPVKTSLFIELENVPGSLYRALGIFAKRGINLTRIESRPSRIDLGYYVFYLDFEGLPDGDLFLELESYAKFIKPLGSYPVF
ncbi:MAG: prephenate dehydratase [Thermococcaceae archaeon]|nr:prephenate dehydratase [Thermococcaceae archaeon]MDK2913573.1 prephenate dehydratase [Thermococcaceae archaeon]